MGHTREECLLNWGSTCWQCDPENHRKPVFSMTFKTTEINHEAFRLIFGPDLESHLVRGEN